MGYREVVTPAIEHWLYRPPREQLAGLVDHLGSSGWLLPEDKADSGSLIYLHPSKVAGTIASTPRDRCLTLYLQGSPGGPYPDDWPEDQLEFTPELCEDVLIIDSPSAVILPRGDYGLTLPCPSCGEDILPPPSGDTPASGDSPLPEHGLDQAPVRCPSCCTELAYSEMALTSEGEPVEEVPFFRFGLVLTAALPRPEPLVSIDPGLLEELERICGVPFRSVAVDV